MKQEVTNPRLAARRYEHSIKGLTRQNHHAAMPSMAGFVCIAPPKIPPLADFEAWIATLPLPTNKPRKITALMLRRIVTMRANGCGDAEIGNSIGATGNFVNRWRHALPAELGGTPVNHHPLSPRARHSAELECQ